MTDLTAIYTPATVENMERLRKETGHPIAAPGIFAYSPETGEQYSASPGDYFWMAPGECLEDSDGQAMVLARSCYVVNPLPDEQGLFLNTQSS